MSWLDSVMLTMLVTGLKENQPVATTSFWGENLISWASKRQATIAMSTVEAEYILAASCCTQLLWMKY